MIRNSLWIKHGAVISSRMRNGPRVYRMLLRYEETCVLNLVIFSSVTIKFGK